MTTPSSTHITSDQYSLRSSLLPPSGRRFFRSRSSEPRSPWTKTNSGRTSSRRNPRQTLPPNSLLLAKPRLKVVPGGQPTPMVSSDSTTESTYRTKVISDSESSEHVTTTLPQATGVRTRPRHLCYGRTLGPDSDSLSEITVSLVLPVRGRRFLAIFPTAR